MGPTVRLALWRVRRRLQRAEDEGRVVSGVWHTSVVSHTAFEPHAAVAEWNGDGNLVVYMSTQGVWANRARLAEALDLPEDKVEVRAEHVGGAFGAKQSLGTETLAAALLARAARRPVRVVFDRLEELSVGGNRPGTDVEISLGWKADHRLAALKVRSVADSGASAGSLVASFLPRFVSGAPGHSSISTPCPTLPQAPPSGLPAGLPLCWRWKALSTRWPPPRERTRSSCVADGTTGRSGRRCTTGQTATNCGRAAATRAADAFAGEWEWLSAPGSKATTRPAK